MHIMAGHKFLAVKKLERENPLKQLLNHSSVDKVVVVAPEEDANTPPFPVRCDDFIFLDVIALRVEQIGVDCALLEEVCGWINAKATVSVWAKMTPNITDFQRCNSVEEDAGVL
ncbi:uncharacterized protein [Cicer arietinum]|uniref:uncharacterized protein isoform X4 n=1 Tax=Cicer arietinum TaxID=3827 RepID=UPI003CC673C1